MSQNEDTTGICDEMNNVIHFITVNPGIHTVSELLTAYIKAYPNKFSVSDIINLSIDLSTRFLSPRVDKLVHNENVINEYATYLNMYLSGKMWESEEDARRNLQPQIDNSQKIIDLTSNKQKED